MRIKRAKNFHENMLYRPDWILSNYPDTVFIFVNNTHIALINPPSNIKNLRQLSIQVYNKVPLWKQSMDLQMGKKPKEFKSSINTMIFEIIPDVMIFKYSYHIYECY